MKNRIAISLALLNFLSACGGTSPQGVGFGTSIGSAANPAQTQTAVAALAPKTVQSSSTPNSSREALFACTDQAGISGIYSTTFTLADGVQRRVVNQGTNVTAAQAAAANACLGNA